MNGWLKKRNREKRPDCWSIILDLGPQPGGRKGRRQKWITFHGTEKEAKRKLRDLLGTADRGEFVEPNKQLTVGAWLDTWLEVATPGRAAHTVLSFENAIRLHLKPGLGAIPLQQLRSVDVEKSDYADVQAGADGLSAGTVKIHANVLGQSLKRAVRDGLVHKNVASLASGPRRTGSGERALNCWTAEEARAVLDAAKEGEPQASALLAVALDSGARKGEIQGLRWSEIDLATGAMRIERQLLSIEEGKPVCGPTKTRKIRTVDLSAETLARLREHRRVQSELKLANRPHYTDHGLVFAQAGNQPGPLGGPLCTSVVRSILAKLTKIADVKRITFHGLRHTSATLLLAAGVQPHVVQQRLGHSGIGTTLNVYGHVIPSMQQDAASRLGAMLYGS